MRKESSIYHIDFKNNNDNNNDDNNNNDNNNNNNDNNNDNNNNDSKIIDIVPFPPLMFKSGLIRIYVLNSIHYW